MPKPTPPLVSGALPGLGHVLEFRSDRTALMRRGFAEHGNIFALKLANQNVAILVGPENHKVFFSETDKALSIQEPYSFLRTTFGEVLFLAPHEVYLEQRPVVLEAFRREKMLHYADVMQEVVQAWLSGLGDSGEIELVSEITHLVQEVAGNCFLGREVHQQLGREFWDLYIDLSKALDPLLPPNLPLPKFIRRDRAKAKMHAILQPVIAERRQHPERYDDFLQDLVNKRYPDGRLAEQELIVNILLALMFAGHETTAGQAAWTIILLLQNPHYLSLVQQEIQQVAPYGLHIDPRRMTQLDHIGWAVREVERMRPSVDMLMRTVKEDVEIGDYVIPQGWLAQVAQDVAHNLPALFDDPEAFDPLRYAPGRVEDKQDRFALIGFGGGTHKCTGMNFANMEMTVISALLFQQFDLELVTRHPQVQRGLGASRPDRAVVRYRRKPQSELLAQAAQQTVEAGVASAVAAFSHN
ncbi:MAG: cytochrome P450 [Anaerolineae bacterium]